MTRVQDPDTGTLVDPEQIGDGQLSEEQLIYKENILDYYRHPRNKRAITSPSTRYRVTNPLCGDTIEFYVSIENGAITDAAFTGSGCAISQASASMLTELMSGKLLDEIQQLSREDVVSMLGIPIGPVRVKCAILGLNAAQKAIGCYREEPHAA